MTQMINVPPRCVCRSESLSAESRSVQSSPSYRLMKSRSESDLSQPESDEEGYTLVQHTLSLSHTLRTCSCVHELHTKRRASHSYIRLCFLFQSGRRNVDLDLAFSHKKRGKDRLQTALSHVVGLSLSSITRSSCLSVF